MSIPKHGSTARGSDNALPYIEEMNKIALLAVSSATQLVEIQRSTVEFVMAELSQATDSLASLKAVPALIQWPVFGERRAQRGTEILLACCEVANQTQAAMLGAMRECLFRPAGAIAASRPHQAKANIERRFRATVINFPDRRLAA